MATKSNELLPYRQFLKTVLKTTTLGLIIILIALAIGMVGYHYTEHMAWVDAFVNAAMILSGMGPVTQLNTVAGKIFAGCYALFSGLGFIMIVGLIFSPIIHRYFHKLHIS